MFRTRTPAKSITGLSRVLRTPLERVMIDSLIKARRCPNAPLTTNGFIVHFSTAIVLHSRLCSRWLVFDCKWDSAHRERTSDLIVNWRSCTLSPTKRHGLLLLRGGLIRLIHSGFRLTFARVAVTFLQRKNLTRIKIIVRAQLLRALIVISTFVELITDRTL